MFPLEFCSVPEGQIARRQIPPDVTRKMVEFSTLKPVDRFRDIERGVGVCPSRLTGLMPADQLTLAPCVWAVGICPPVRLDRRNGQWAA